MANELTKVRQAGWPDRTPLFRILLWQGIAWTAKEPVEHFNELIWPGANITT